jgi:replicative DNA helicase
VTVPHSIEAERSVLGQMLSNEKLIGEVIGTKLAPDDFHIPAHRLLFEQISIAYYADTPTDALSIGEGCAAHLAKLWSCTDQDAVTRTRELALGQQFTGSAIDHARVVKKHADMRHLLDLAKSIENAVNADEKGPEEIAGLASHNAMKIATSTLLTHDLHTFGDLGRRYIKSLQELRQLRAQGIEVGAKFDMQFIDHYTRGLRPTELFFGAGEPGVGKSAVFWHAGLKFAQRQMRKDPEDRVGTLILSLEMGEEPSNIRIAQGLAKIDGGKLREGDVSDEQVKTIIDEWGRRRELPLYMNFQSALRLSQMRTLIVESIRRYNVGLVIIDHFRHFDMDDKYQSKTEEDEDKVKALKQMCKDLNIAVICVAHTTKGVENTNDGRPFLSHLRGSGQIAAEADFVAFVYRPFMYASDEDKLEGYIKETDAELIYRKNRHGLDGIVPFYMQLETMDIHD